ncbi:hypothetical protein KQI65_03795 [bacterium]|nr:hypothetical protein [bacterium]
MSESREGKEVQGQQLDDARSALIASIEEIGAERNEYAARAQWLKRLSGLFNVLIVLLSIASPAMVTYLTQQPSPDPSLTLKTIILVALTGVVATLRSVLKWGEQYGFAVMTAMKLRELESHARLEMEEVLNTANDMVVHGKLTALNQELQERWTAIVRRHLVSGGYGGEGNDVNGKG